MHRFFTSFLGLVLGFISPASAQPSNLFLEPEIPISRNLQTAADELLDFISGSGSRSLQVETCEEQLSALYQSIYTLSPEHFLSGPEGAENKKALTAPQQNNPLYKVFLARVALRKQYRKWVQTNAFSSYEELQNCSNGLKVMARSLRGFEDYYGQITLAEQGFFAQPQEQQKTKKFANNDFPHALLHPD